MQYWLQILLLAILILVSSLVLFGESGGFVSAVVFITALLLNRARFNAVILVMVVVLLLYYLLMPTVYSSREASSRVRCLNNLKQISIALLNYESQYHCFPPPYVLGKDGKPMHSWRVLILPYLDKQDLYDKYNFNEPWNGPNNQKLFKYRPRVFACCADEHASADDALVTSYVAIVGKDALWRADKPRRLDDLDSPSSTAMLIEVANSGINWMEPRDINLDIPTPHGSAPPDLIQSIGHLSSYGFFIRDTSSTSTGANISFADGRAEFLPADVIASDKFTSLLTVGGYTDEALRALPPGQTSDHLQQHFHRRIVWTNCLALAVWIVSSALLFYLAWRSRRIRLEDSAHSGSC